MANRLPRGALPSPRHKLLAAHPHRVLFAAPTQFSVTLPSQLDMWGNDQFGDCVSAEEAFNKACRNPEVFIDPSIVIAWAQRHGWLNGANLTDVMDAMQTDGFQVGPQQYNDGPYTGVDYNDEGVIQSALSTIGQDGIAGPLKIAIDADALPPGAGNQMGWWTTQSGTWNNTDHCVSIAAYGRADFCFDAMKVSLPTALSASTPGYLVYTWKTIGFVVFGWLKGTCREAWKRSPSTVGVPPLTPPTPPNPPVPPTPPGPAVDLPPGTYNLTPGGIYTLNPGIAPSPIPNVIPQLIRDDVQKLVTDLNTLHGRPGK